ncbi:hypothetical protein SCMC78_70050 [Streptomyces sp. CMC78]|uniref:Secreted protein n=1 Tax=Streptomyces sp. CMC78 TaxID=3231512 RepID=A0AB33KYW3_9ACTN
MGSPNLWVIRFTLVLCARLAKTTLKPSLTAEVFPPVAPAPTARAGPERTGVRDLAEGEFFRSSSGGPNSRQPSSLREMPYRLGVQRGPAQSVLRPSHSVSWKGK